MGALWHKCGVSVIVNIGAGAPNASDSRYIARRFFRGSKAATISPAYLHKGPSSGAGEVTTYCKRVRSHDYETTEEAPHDDSTFSHRIKFDQDIPTSTRDTERRTSMARHAIFASEKVVGIEQKLRTTKNNIEADIRRELRNL